MRRQPADTVEKIVATYTWQMALGNKTTDMPLCRIVQNSDHPLVWDANHISRVRAETPAGSPRR